MHHGAALLIFSGALVAVGCSRGEFATYPVEGRVAFPDGTPLHGGTVEFQSVGNQPKRITARGQIGEDGRYRLSTFARNDGAIAGPHRVLVSPALPPGPINPYQNPKPVIHEKYLKFDTSGWEFTVDPDGDNTFDITVERPR